MNTPCVPWQCWTKVVGWRADLMELRFGVRHFQIDVVSINDRSAVGRFSDARRRVAIVCSSFLFSCLFKAALQCVPISSGITFPRNPVRSLPLQLLKERHFSKSLFPEERNISEYMVSTACFDVVIILALKKGNGESNRKANSYQQFWSFRS